MAPLAQKDELDVLKSIFGDLITLFDGLEQYSTFVFDAGKGVSVSVSLPETYPLDIPTFEIGGDIDENLQSDLQAQLVQNACQHRGEAMLFSILSDLEQLLSDRSVQSDIPETRQSICKFYLKNSCKFGNQCHNLHSGHAKEEAYSLKTTTSLEMDNRKDLPKSKSGGVKKPAKKAAAETQESCKKKSMKTAIDVINRILWDESLPTALFTVGYLDRFLGVIEKGFNEFSWEDLASVDYNVLAIPKHRIQYFKFQDQIVWDKNKRIDKVFGSTGDKECIADIVKNYCTEFPSENCNLSTGKDVEAEVDDCYAGDDADSEKLRDPDSGGRPNFFACFRVMDDQIASRVEEVQKYITSSDGRMSPGMRERRAYHVTLCMMRLVSDSDKKKACEVLKLMQPILVTMLPQTRLFRFESLATFRGRVLYVRVADDPVLSKFVALLTAKLKDAGIQLLGNHNVYQPHLTIMQLTRPMCKELNTDVIAFPFYAKYANTHFGVQPIQSVLLCSTSRERGDDGFYVTLSEVYNSLLTLSPKVPVILAKHVQKVVSRGSLPEAVGSQFIAEIQSSDESIRENAVLRMQSRLASMDCDSRTQMVVVVRGLPGSGKSYFLQSCTEKLLDHDFEVCSADEYFASKPNEYSFSGKEIADAHAFCRGRFFDALENEVRIVAIDNTNSQLWEYDVYRRVAALVGYKFYVLEIPCPDETTMGLFSKRCRHRVGASVYKNLWERWERDPDAKLIAAHDASLRPSMLSIISQCKDDIARVQSILYAAMYLTADSRQTLLDLYPSVHKKLVADHVTLMYGPCLTDVIHLPVGKSHHVKVVGYVCNDLVQVVAVEEDEVDRYCTRLVPHVTISTSSKAAPRHAEAFLADRGAWIRPSSAVVLHGTIGVQVAVSSTESVRVVKSDSFSRVCELLAAQSSDCNVSRPTEEERIAESGSWSATCLSPADNQDAPKASDAVEVALYFGPRLVKSIFVFDFDGTLFHTPDSGTGRSAYFQLTGTSWPFRGWLGRPESLEFPLQVYPGPALRDFFDHCGQACSLTVILTGRLERTRRGVERVLKQYGVRADRVILKPDVGTDAPDRYRTSVVAKYKKEVVRDLLLEFPGTETVKFWDDRSENIDVIDGMKQEFKHVKIETLLVIDHKVHELESFIRTAGLEALLEDQGLRPTAVCEKAIDEGMLFLQATWKDVLKADDCVDMSRLVLPFGSRLLKRRGDVDVCLLAPSRWTQSDCLFKMKEKLKSFGCQRIHSSPPHVRCPRLRVCFEFIHAPPTEFDLVFAAVLGEDLRVSDDELDQLLLQPSTDSNKAALSGFRFYQDNVSKCLHVLSASLLGMIVDYVVLFLTRRFLKGNCFHCIRTFQIVKLLCQYVDAHASSLVRLEDDIDIGNAESVTKFMLSFFRFLADYPYESWIASLGGFVPDTYIPLMVHAFADAAKLLEKHRSLSQLCHFIAVDGPLRRTIRISLSSPNPVSTWQAFLYVEYKLGSVVREMIASGIDVKPGVSTCTEFEFSIPNLEHQVKRCRASLQALVTGQREKDVTISIDM